MPETRARHTCCTVAFLGLVLLGWLVYSCFTPPEGPDSARLHELTERIRDLPSARRAYREELYFRHQVASGGGNRSEPPGSVLASPTTVFLAWLAGIPVDSVWKENDLALFLGFAERVNRGTFALVNLLRERNNEQDWPHAARLASGIQRDLTALATKVPSCQNACKHVEQLCTAVVELSRLWEQLRQARDDPVQVESVLAHVRTLSLPPVPHSLRSAIEVLEKEKNKLYFVSEHELLEASLRGKPIAEELIGNALEHVKSHGDPGADTRLVEQLVRSAWRELPRTGLCRAQLVKVGGQIIFRVRQQHDGVDVVVDKEGRRRVFPTGALGPSQPLEVDRLSDELDKLLLELTEKTPAQALRTINAMLDTLDRQRDPRVSGEHPDEHALQEGISFDYDLLRKVKETLELAFSEGDMS